ncbi:hypothetical protein MAR_022012, partial [Mya arenaria]
FAALIRDFDLGAHFERSSISVFVPVSSSYETFLLEAAALGYNLTDRQTVENILLYHITDGITSVADMATRKSAMTSLQGDKRLFFDNLPYGTLWRRL